MLQCHTYFLVDAVLMSEVFGRLDISRMTPTLWLYTEYVAKLLLHDKGMSLSFW